MTGEPTGADHFRDAPKKVARPMTMEERVALIPRKAHDLGFSILPLEALALVRAAFPELFDGTGWIAPMALTDEMREAAATVPGMRAIDGLLALAAVRGGGDQRIDNPPNSPLDQAFEAMTKAYLKEGK